MVFLLYMLIFSILVIKTLITLTILIKIEEKLKENYLMLEAF